MNVAHCVLLAVPLLAACVGAAPRGGLRDDTARILAAAEADETAWPRLEYLCDRIGHRLAGSRGLEQAVAWAAAEMRAAGLENVRAEPVMVPVWVRGEERAVLLGAPERELHPLGLGGTVGTPAGGIEAEVLVVRDFDELEARSAEVRGRIVLFDAALPAFDPVRGSGYGEVVRYRTQGPSRAAAHGAVACLVRSVTARSLQTPHTGMLSYDETQPRIPAAAVTIEDAELLARLAAAGERPRVRLELGARTLPDAPSANVVGELVGRERPEEVVVVGAHLDSWDVGQGAHDDGGSCVAAMTAVTLLRDLGLRPRRTVRVVLFTNEENGLAGAKAYAADHAAELPLHVAAIEADSGTFAPIGFSTPAPKDESDTRRARAREQLTELLELLAPLGRMRLADGGGGADLGPMAREGVLDIGLDVAGDLYFDYHHTDADTLDKVDPQDLRRCTAALAVLTYTLAEMPERLGE